MIENTTLSYNKKFLLRLFKQIDSGLLIIDERGRICHSNDFARQLLGYSDDTLIGKSVFEINPQLNYRTWKTLFSQRPDEANSKVGEIYTSTDRFVTVTTEAIRFPLDGVPHCFYFIHTVNQVYRYRNLLNHIFVQNNIGAWDWDANADTFYLTDQFISLLGLPSYQNVVSTDDFFKFFSEQNDTSTLRLAFEKVVKDKTSFSSEINYFHENQEKSFILYAFPEKQGNKIPKVYGMIQDISKVAFDKKRLIADFTLNNTNDLIFWVKPDGGFYYVNDQVCQSMEYSKEELLTKDVFDISSEFNPEQWKIHWQNLKVEKHINFESHIFSKNGKRIPVIADLNFIEFHGEEYNIAVCRDITKKLERDELIDLSHATLDQSKGFIFWCDEHGRIRFSNQSTQDHLAYKASELREMSILQLIPTIDTSDWKKSIGSEKDHHILSGDGTITPVEIIHTSVIHKENCFECITVYDISERKLKEQKLKKALEEISLLKERIESEKDYLREEVNVSSNFNNIICKSKSYQNVLSKVAMVADSDTTVLVLGETGTGKELLARSIHDLSNRSSAAMIKINCAALPKYLIESELFGHEKGSFTGASERRVGRFELAHKGTLFLDEIGELPLSLQAKLLRVLQEGELVRVGGNKTIKVDVRLITATNRNLEKLVSKGLFREDLYYRLNVFPIYNIPLRERREDIIPIALHFIDSLSSKMNRPIKTIRQDYIDTLNEYDYPGNIRELINLVERSIILSENGVLTRDLIQIN